MQGRYYTSGGSGHEPTHAGYVGEGIFLAIIYGYVFSALSMNAILVLSYKFLDFHFVMDHDELGIIVSWHVKPPTLCLGISSHIFVHFCFVLSWL